MATARTFSSDGGSFGNDLDGRVGRRARFVAAFDLYLRPCVENEAERVRPRAALDRVEKVWL